VPVPGAALCAALALLGCRADAQPRPPRLAERPAYWGSLTAGLLQAQEVLDGRTNSVWQFARNAAQYRATAELALDDGLSVGLQGSFAPAVPTTYGTLGLANRPAPDACRPSCSASTDVAGLAAFGRVGGGRGLHQVIEATLGVVQFRNFRTDDGGRLPPTADTDLHASVGYGFGFGFGPRAAVSLVQEFGIVSHQRDGLARDQSALVQQRATRLSLRLGGGNRDAIRRR
jgi:hypothetical protein